VSGVKNVCMGGQVGGWVGGVYNLQVCMGSWVPVYGVFRYFSGSCFGVYDAWLSVYSDYSASLVACFEVYNILWYTAILLV